jgi:hypothetical protein
MWKIIATPLPSLTDLTQVLKARGDRAPARGVLFSAAICVGLLFCASARADTTAPKNGCDTAASFEFDGQRVAPGVSYVAINAPVAIAACVQAVRLYPASGRLHFELGRAFEKAGNLPRAIAAYNRAAQLGHGGGFNNLGELYRAGKGAPRNLGIARQEFEAGSALGYPEAEFNLANLLLRQAPTDANAERARQLLTSALNAGYTDASGVLQRLPAPAASAPDNAPAGCAFHSLFVSGRISTGGPLSLILGDGVHDWGEGPITILNAGQKRCTVSPDVSLVGKQILLTDNGYLFVDTYSGSSLDLYMIDTKDCSIRWTSNSNIDNKRFDLFDPRFSKAAISFGLVGADEHPLKKRLTVPFGPDCVPATIKPIPSQNAAAASQSRDLAPLTANRVSYRWTSGYGQGTSESSIISKDGNAVFRIYCADGQSPQSAGIELEIHDRLLSLTGTKIAQVTTGDKTFQMNIVNGMSTADAMGDKNDLINLATELTKTESGNFTVAVPDMNWEAQFSVLGARSVLISPTPTNKHATVIDACVQP